MRSLTVRVPARERRGKAPEARPPGGNALHRMNHWQVRKSREEWGLSAQIAAADALRGQSWEPLEYCQIAVTWRCRVRRTRDWDNLISGLKPLIDGLVRAGVIRGDDTSCLLHLGPFRVEVGSERDETILEVRECDAGGIHHLGPYPSRPLTPEEIEDQPYLRALHESVMQRILGEE